MVAFISCVPLLLCFVFLFGAMARLLEARREALLAAAVVSGALLVLVTESTSLFSAFSYLPIVTAWIVLAALSFGLLMMARNWPRLRRSTPSSFSPLVVACSLAGLLIVSLIAVLAVLAPPNTVDSLTYHMPRVMNWIQHRTVAHYQTGILRQLYLGPCAEFAVAQLQILTGVDRLANLPQFFSMIGSAPGVSVIARRLGSGAAGQSVAALFAVTIPIGMLEASSAQTDFVAAFWAVCVANFAFSLRDKQEAAQPLRRLILGLATGLAVLTKLTTLFFIAPFLGLLVLEQLRDAPRRAFHLVAAVGLLALSINAGHLGRNLKAFGRPTAPRDESAMYSNATHLPGSMLCNILRNVFTNLAMPRCGFLDPLAHRVIPLLSRTDVNDSRITYLQEPFAVIWSRHEDYASNPLQIMLGSACLLAGLFYWRRQNAIAVYAICIGLAGCLFCWELRWQPWITRLQLPGFVLVSPVVGAILEKIKFKTVPWVVAFMLTLNAIYYPLFGSPRCLIGPSSVLRVPRQDQYLAAIGPETRADIRSFDLLIARMHPRVIELDTGGNDLEYPVWLAIGPSMLIQHIHPHLDSIGCAPFQYTPHPDLIVTLAESSTRSRPLPLLLQNNEFRVYRGPN